MLKELEQPENPGDNPDPPASSTTAPNRPVRASRIQGLLGTATVVAVVASTAPAVISSAVAMQVVLAVAGFQLARAIHRSSSATNWRRPLVLGLAARTVPTVLLLVLLVGLHGLATGGMSGTELTALAAAATFTSNIVPILFDASFLPVSHLWAVALLIQVALAAPVLLTVGQRHIGPFTRSVALLIGAGAMSIIRVLAVGVGGLTDPQLWLAPPSQDWLGAVAVWTSLDAVLVGLAVGTFPLANLHRRPTAKLVAPALVMLGVLLFVPLGSAVVQIGFALPTAAFLTGLILAAEAISSLPRAVGRVLANPWLHRIGSRAFGLYLWHLPFAYGLFDGVVFEWPGLFGLVILLTLTLAAATTTYRYIELPVQAALARKAARWFSLELMMLPSPEPQVGKWIRWDDITIDHLPRPTLRRERRVKEPGAVCRRLWQSGDRQLVLSSVASHQNGEEPESITPQPAPPRHREAPSAAVG